MGRKNGLGSNLVNYLLLSLRSELCKNKRKNFGVIAVIVWTERTCHSSGLVAKSSTILRAVHHLVVSRLTFLTLLYIRRLIFLVIFFYYLLIFSGELPGWIDQVDRPRLQSTLSQVYQV